MCLQRVTTGQLLMSNAHFACACAFVGFFFKLYFGYLVGTGRDGANLWQIDLMSGLGRAVVCVLQFCTTSKLNAARKRDVVIFFVVTFILRKTTDNKNVRFGLLCGKCQCKLLAFVFKLLLLAVN